MEVLVDRNYIIMRGDFEFYNPEILLKKNPTTNCQSEKQEEK